MQNEKIEELLKRMLVEAHPGAEQEPSASSLCPAEDDELLLRWSLGELAKEEHDAIVKHIARCPACTEELADMLHSGVLVLPAVTDQATQEQTSTPKIATRRTPRVSLRSRLLAIALVLIVAVTLGVWTFSTLDLPAGPGVQIAALEKPTLADYGYDDAGQPFVKSVPVMDPKAMKQWKVLLTKKENATNPQLLVNYAEFLLSQADWDGAIEQLEKAKEMVPISPQILNALGIAHYQKADFAGDAPEIAITFFEKAAKIAPKNSDIKKNLNVCRKRLEK